MISLKQCEAYLNECQALAAETKLSLRRATAGMAVCHAWLALRDAVRIDAQNTYKMDGLLLE
jgi:hypothetical protein